MGWDVRAPDDGFVMLPLYQGQGEDGFFWGREVSRARLRASVALRFNFVEARAGGRPPRGREHGLGRRDRAVAAGIRS